MTTFEFLITALASLATVGLGMGLLRTTGLANLPTTLYVGAGYGVGVVAFAKLSHLMSFVGAPLNTSGWILVVLGLIAGGWALGLHSLSQQKPAVVPEPAPFDWLVDGVRIWYRDPIVVALLLLLGMHLAITLSNNVLRPVFPWDAFTTWMYRAKAWALQNAITPTVSVEDWIAAGGQSGYALYANHYPTALSIYAALLSALVGGWHPAAASIPWSLCLLALCLTAHGVLVLAGVSNRLATIGAYFLGSMPLLNIHAALAGYGDVWMALYAGVGLATLLVWRATDRGTALWLGLLLLTLGTQIKTEGWVWLGLGLTFLLFERIAARFGYRVLLASLIIVAGLIWGSGLTHLPLGPLGQWGIDDSHVHVGPLGSYGLRLYNPASNYWSIFFEQANFLLLAGFYLLAMAAITFRWRHRAVSFWIMGLLIALSQLIIFGASSYSQYAETGTAIARLFLHFAPVAVVTIILGWAACILKVPATESGTEHLSTKNSYEGTRLKLLLPSALIVACLITPSLFLMLNQAPPTLKVNSADMLPVVGQTETSTQGIRFVESPLEIGVLKASSSKPIEPTRYLYTDASLPSASSASFYWITEGETGVNSTPIPLPGKSLIDLERYGAWRSGKKKEVGVLVQSSDFEGTLVREVSLTNSLSTAALPAMFNQWNAKEALTQKSVNNTLGHHDAPATLATWLNGSILVFVILIVALSLTKRTGATAAIAGTTLLGIWLIAGTMTLAQTPMLDCLGPGSQCLTTDGDDPHAASVPELAEQILEHTSAKSPLLIIDIGDALTAQKLPLLLLPRQAVHVTGFNEKLATDWSGPVVLVAKDKARLDKASALFTSQPQTGTMKNLPNARLFPGKTS